MNYYYTDNENQVRGPVSEETLRSLFADGQIEGETNIVAEGAQDWILFKDSGLYSRPDKPKKSSKQPRQSLPDVIAEKGERLLNIARKGIDAGRIDTILRHFRTVGLYSLIICAGLGAICTLVSSIKHNDTSIFIGGLGFGLTILILTGVAVVFLRDSVKLVNNSPSAVSTRAVLDSLALLLLIGAIGVFIGGLIASIKSDIWSIFIFSIIYAFLLILSASLALNPESVNLKVDNVSAGEEAIGLVSYLLKGGIRLLPVLFAYVGIAGIVVEVFELVGMLSNNGSNEVVGALLAIVPRGMSRILGFGIAGLLFGIFAALLPLVYYILFLVFYLLIDLIRAIVSIPSKLDSLKN